MIDIIIVMTATRTKKDAEKIAALLLEKRMVACVQMFPIESMQFTEGKTKKSKEYLCMMKTKDYMFSRIRKKIEDIHPYGTPEIVAVQAVKFSEAYLAWVNSEVRE